MCGGKTPTLGSGMMKKKSDIFFFIIPAPRESLICKIFS